MRARAARLAAAIPRPRAGRRAAAQRLEAALPDLPLAERRRILARSFSHQARVAAETRELARIDPARLCSRLELDGWERIEEAESAGAGLVVLSASLGFFELVPAVLALYKGGGDRRRLARLDDPEPADAGIEPIEATFLGRPFRASSEAARWVLERGCSALPIFAFLEPRRSFTVSVRPPISPPRPGVEPEGLTRQYLAAIEAEILARPEQYSWMPPRVDAR